MSVWILHDPKAEPLGDLWGSVWPLPSMGRGRTLVLGTPGRAEQRNPWVLQSRESREGGSRNWGPLTAWKEGESGEEGPLGSQGSPSEASVKKGPHGPPKVPGSSLSRTLEKGNPWSHWTPIIPGKGNLWSPEVERSEMENTLEGFWTESR